MALHVIKFEQRYTKKHGAEDWVLLGPKGEALERTKSWHRVKDLIPRDLSEMFDDEAEVVRQSLSYQTMSARWSIIEPQYKAWKQGTDIPDEGTPLGAWAGVTAEQASYLRKFGVLTVEDAAAMDDRTIAKLPFPEPRAIKRMASDFLEQKPVEDVKAENEELKIRLAALEESILAMNAKEEAEEKATTKAAPKGKQGAEAA